jgi:tRNA uridine 5-carboxymethylaminomethyl modification enzyme
VQVELIHSIPGLEKAVMLRPAYAVEYDFAPPTQLQPSLESKVVDNLFFAGQINGTSGYEEAAGQGLLAGVNAVQKVRQGAPLVLGRHEAYLGVMVDDLVTKGTREPYRMFTSRAEYRLLLNHGSAELRLGEHAGRLGLISGDRLARVRDKREKIENWVRWMETNTTAGGSWGDVLRRNHFCAMPPGFSDESSAVREEVVYRVIYRGYLERETKQAGRLAEADRIKIPREFDFLALPGLKKESAQRLAEARPFTVGQASRLSGVNPADISILMIAISRRGP